MTFEEYQKEAMKTAVYPSIKVVSDLPDQIFQFQKTLQVTADYIYPTLGLEGESGEVCEKIKKIIRDNHGVVRQDEKETLRREIGDILWYIAMLCTELGFSLEEVAQINLQKLKDRQEREKLHGEGDNR